MRKIPTLFKRDPDNMRYVLPEVNPDCEWVFTDVGVVPTRQYDGTCVMLDSDGKWWARREVKPGKTPPPNYRPISTDPNTGKTVGWEPIEQSSFAPFHAEAIAGEEADEKWPEGTYELVGPRINGNPEREERHTLLWHEGAEEVFLGPRAQWSYELLRQEIAYLAAAYGAEGVVFHGREGKMAKIKARDFPPGAE